MTTEVLLDRIGDVLAWQPGDPIHDPRVSSLRGNTHRRLFDVIADHPERCDCDDVGWRSEDALNWFARHASGTDPCSPRIVGVPELDYFAEYAPATRTLTLHGVNPAGYFESDDRTWSFDGVDLAFVSEPTRTLVLDAARRFSDLGLQMEAVLASVAETCSMSVDELVAAVESFGSAPRPEPPRNGPPQPRLDGRRTR